MPRYTVDDLSRGFLKSVLDGSYGTDDVPVVQILEARPISKSEKPSAADTRFRFRISDGTFSYSSCLNQSQLSAKIHENKLYEGTPIIRLDRYNFTNANPNSGNRPLIIIDYTLLSTEEPVLGNPIPHTGNPKDYQGLNPSAIAQNANRSAVRDEPSATVGAGQFHHDLPRTESARENGAASNRNRMGILNSNVTPIKLITPYVNRWRIFGVVTAKEDMRELKTAARGDMKVFNFELTDDQGGCIRIAAFNDVAEKYYAAVQKGMMYYVSGATVKQANKRYNTTGHDYEISLRSDSELVPCTDREKIQQPKMSLSITSLGHVASRANECIDVLAIVDRVNEIQQVTQRSTGEPLDKRDLELIDESGVVVALTVWGELAHKLDKSCEHQTIGVKGAWVREFNGMFSMSMTKSSRMELNLECAETEKLYSWYKDKRPQIHASSISRGGGGDYGRDLRAIGVATDFAFGKNEEKGVVFYALGYITLLKSDGALYKSCGTNGCRKKVIDIDNQYRCEKCNLSLTSFKYVLLLSVEIADFTGTHWVTLFEDQASKLLGKGADELGHLLDTNRLEEYNEIFNSVRFRPFVFKIRSKNEFFNDNERIKWVAFSVEQVNYDKYLVELRKSLEVTEGV